MATTLPGAMASAPPLVHKIYEPGHHADGAFLLAVSRGVRAHHWPFGDMPPVDGVSQEDVQKIVAYVRALQRGKRDQLNSRGGTRALNLRDCFLISAVAPSFGTGLGSGDGRWPSVRCIDCDLGLGLQ